MKVKMLYVHKFFMHPEIESAKGKIWELIAIYASPSASICKFIWGMKDEMKIECLWLILGDFNFV